LNIDLLKLPKKVKIMEVGPRDGLQNECALIDTPTKVRLVESLVAAGHKRIEMTAFVSPKWIPPLSDHKEVARLVKKKRNTQYAALIPNVQGYEAAKAARVSEVAFVISASNTHNLKNINASTREAYKRYSEIALRAKQDKIKFRVYISCSFGCPYEDKIAVSKVVNLTEKFLELGAYEISIGDTIGVANPKQVVKLLEKLKNKNINIKKIALHLHDTYGRALANCFAGLTCGVLSFDTSIGGLGGCPYAPGAAGNLATEDLVSMLDGMSIETGLDLKKLVKISQSLEKKLKRKLISKAYLAHKN